MTGKPEVNVKWREQAIALKTLTRVCLTVATLSDSTDCKVKSWLSHLG